MNFLDNIKYPIKQIWKNYKNSFIELSPRKKDLQIKIVDKRIGDTIPLPTYATEGSAGLDIRACIDKPITLLPGETHLIPTGFAVFIEDPKLVGILVPRSGLSIKHSIGLKNLIGIIDSDYQNELQVATWNHSDMNNYWYDYETISTVAESDDTILIWWLDGHISEMKYSDYTHYEFKNNEDKFFSKFKIKDKLGCNNPGSFTINPGDRIAQLLIMPVEQPRLKVVNDFASVTTRGLNGYGSSGIK